MVLKLRTAMHNPMTDHGRLALNRLLTGLNQSVQCLFLRFTGTSTLGYDASFTSREPHSPASTDFIHCSV